MRLLLINAVCGTGSTGRICTEIAKEYEKKGYDVKIAYGRQAYVPDQYKKYAMRIGTDKDVKIHAIYTRLTDYHGFGSKRATKHFLKWVNEFNPDILWLHNLHGYYINIELLFQWIKTRPDMRVRWTLHDCWAFTGHCAYFTVAACMQWKSHCMHCMEKKHYPASYGKDHCFQNFDRKKTAFTGVKNMQLIVPSEWLAGLVKKSFLKEYPVEVVYNTIDFGVFKPTPSDFRERYGLQDKKVILGVANTWNERKGLADFFELAQMLDDQYAIILVGLDEKQIKKLPRNISGLKRVNSKKELIAIYSVTDIFANSSHENTFDMAAFASTTCEVKTVAYKNTLCEKVIRRNNGVAIPEGVVHLYKEITGATCKNNRNVRKGIRILCIPRTNSAQELAAIYTAADFFINPTHEDNFPTVNLEAMACGAYVITYDVGGAKETIDYFEILKNSNLYNCLS